MPAISGPNVARSASGQLLAQGPPGADGAPGPPGPAGPPGGPLTPLRVAGTGSIQATVGSIVLADPFNGGVSSGSPTVLVPTSPGDGNVFKVKDTTATANATTQKIAINPGGANIEDPQNPGTYVTSTVYIVQPSACVEWTWDNVKAHWGITGGA